MKIQHFLLIICDVCGKPAFHAYHFCKQHRPQTKTSSDISYMQFQAENPQLRNNRSSDKEREKELLDYVEEFE